MYKLAMRAPAFPTTAMSAPLLYVGGVSSATTIRTTLTFQAGDWVAILGACGDTSTMRNSYGAIEPLGMAPYFSFPAEVGRIEVSYASAVIAGNGPALSAPTSGGKPYVCATSLGTGPIPIDLRTLALSVDALFGLSVGNALPSRSMCARPRASTT